MKLHHIAALLVGIALGSAAPAVLHAQQAPAAASASAFQPFPGAIPAETVTPAMLDQEVAIVGKIQRLVPSSGERIPTQVFLHEKEGSPAVMLVYWPDTAPQVEGTQGPLAVGTALSAKGKIEEHRGNLQIRIRSGAQLLVEGRAAAQPAAAQPRAQTAGAPANQAKPGPDGYFTVADIPNLGWRMDKDISLKGTITRFQAPTSERAPNAIHLGEGPNQIQIVYWAEEGKTAPVFDKTGEMVYATGKLGMYRERLQLRISDMERLSYSPLAPALLAKVDEPATGAAARPATEGWEGRQPGTAHLERPVQKLEPGTIVPVAQIAPAHAGNVIITSGVIRHILNQPDAKGVAIVDGSAMLTVRLPKETEMKFKNGEKVSVMGKVVYNDQRAQAEVVVEDPQGIQISTE